jgi:N6-L-threonylcarbamoyladenine synthase
MLVDRTRHAIAIFRGRYGRSPAIVVAGGVAANRAIACSLDVLAAKEGVRLVIPPAALCTDNAVMVAWTGIERLERGLVDGLDAPTRPRWPLDPDAEPALGGKGAKGPKA